MALQGTIDSFPLTDVLTLLSTSKKSGRLTLEGDRGSASLWIADGEVIGGDMAAGTGATAASLLFEMLRFDEASFAFDDVPPGAAPQHAVGSTGLEEAMEQATSLLEEWDDILSVVPSLAHRVVLAEELPEESVTLDAASWALVLAAAANPVVAVIGDSLGLDEFGACSAAVSLVERGLATIEEPVAYEPFVEAAVETAPEAAAETELEAAVETAAEERAGSDRFDPPAIDLAVVDSDDELPADEDRAGTGFPDRFPIDDLLGGADAAVDEVWGTTEGRSFTGAAFGSSDLDQASTDEPAFSSAAFDGLPPLERVSPGDERPGPDAWDDLVPADEVDVDVSDTPAEAVEETDDSTDEVLRQMSKLSPQAAEAIAAALSSVPASAPAQDAPTSRGDADGEGDGPVTFSGMF